MSGGVIMCVRAADVGPWQILPGSVLAVCRSCGCEVWVSAGSVEVWAGSPDTELSCSPCLLPHLDVGTVFELPPVEDLLEILRMQADDDGDDSPSSDGS